MLLYLSECNKHGNSVQHNLNVNDICYRSLPLLLIALTRRSQGSAVSIVTRLQFGRPRSRVLALGSTQPPVQWKPGAVSPIVKRPKRKAHRSLHLVPRLRIALSFLLPPFWSIGHS
jgi:hypothetical protein